MNIVDEIKESFKKGSVLTRLIYVNLAVFIVVKIIHVFFFLAGQEFPLLNWLAMPADLNLLAGKPWTVISYMFLHFNFIHILFNILWLYWLGKIFLMYFSERHLLGVYLLGGMFGGLFYFGGYNLFPAFAEIVPFSQLLGASAAVIAIVMAVAFHAPNHSINLMFIGPVKMKYIALISIILYVIGISSSNAGGNLAHIGGAVFGMLFALQYKKGIDMTKVINTLIDAIVNLFKPKPKVKVTYKRTSNTDINYNRQKNAEQARINDILEKISKSGYDSLTKEEKEILFKMGK